ncbi:DUF4395 domain-containing protein [Sulfurimonas lithotrophica]|uniref:DUF4395 domain-containing protein n=1 Tax=Sulfurimonas lithotrophica TaxID=2590022 RepID=A0A5P8P0A3_9BACT|nr:DUF4395 family protein [Sulfurimonas lithotrophica]QFR49129.1 DUF4395 domain-containing protein [Sulfurimonas lithotrophica]
MGYACPIAFEKIDSGISRISSLIVSIFVTYYLYSFNIYILYFLFLDFYMRIFCQKNFSLIFLISKMLKKVLNIKDAFTDSGAKKLAGLFGIFFILLLVLLNHMDLKEFSFLVGGIFILCSLLDASINYCVGCKVYFIIKKIYPSFMS